MVQVSKEEIDALGIQVNYDSSHLSHMHKPPYLTIVNSTFIIPYSIYVEH